MSIPHSAEHNEKIRQSNLGQTRSPETRERMRQAKLGKTSPPHTPETIAKMRVSHAGKVILVAQREQISKTLTGRKNGPQSAERRARQGAAISAARRGKPASETKRASLRAHAALELPDCTCVVHGPLMRGTLPELILQELLHHAGYAIAANKRFGRYEVDVWAPEIGIAFEADGDYFHTLFGRQEADAARDTHILARFPEVKAIVRLWEWELREIKELMNG